MAPEERDELRERLDKAGIPRIKKTRTGKGKARSRNAIRYRKRNKQKKGQNKVKFAPAFWESLRKMGIDETLIEELKEKYKK